MIRLLGLDGRTHPALSTGDADLLHRFLRDTRRSTPTNPEERDALAQMYRYLSACDWMPSHLAAEYRLRADTLAPHPIESAEESETVPEPAVTEIAPSPPLPESLPTEQEISESLSDLPSMDLGPDEEEIPLPGPDPFRPEPIPEPEPPLPLPEPPAPQEEGEKSDDSSGGAS